MATLDRTMLFAMASMALTTAQHLRVRAYRLGDGRLRIEVRSEAGTIESEWEGTSEEWNEALQSARTSYPPSVCEPKRDSSPPS